MPDHPQARKTYIDGCLDMAMIGCEEKCKKMCDDAAHEKDANV
jgi:hypothetical protein